MSWVYDPDEADAEDSGADEAAAAAPESVDGAVPKGAALIKLKGAEAIEKEIAAIQKRVDHYQDRFDRAQAAGDQDALNAAEAKLVDKNRAIAELRAKLEGLMVVAPKAGAVTISVAVGDELEAGAEVAQVEGRPVLEAEFPATVGGSYAVGDQVTIASHDDDSRTERCQVSRVTADVVAVACAGDLPAGPVVLPEPEL